MTFPRGRIDENWATFEEKSASVSELIVSGNRGLQQLDEVRPCIPIPSLNGNQKPLSLAAAKPPRRFATFSKPLPFSAQAAR